MEEESVQAQEFGDLLRKMRVATGVSMWTVARHLDVTVEYISAVERGLRAPLTTHRLLDVARFLGIDPDPLLAAAAKTRGSFVLDTNGNNPRAVAVSASLARAWPNLTDEDFDRIEDILRKPSRRAEAVDEVFAEAFAEADVADAEVRKKERVWKSRR